MRWSRNLKSWCWGINAYRENECSLSAVSCIKSSIFKEILLRETRERRTFRTIIALRTLFVERKKGRVRNAAHLNFPLTRQSYYLSPEVHRQEIRMCTSRATFLRRKPYGNASLCSSFHAWDISLAIFILFLTTES